MSITTAVSRIQEIEAMIAAAAAGNPNPGAAASGFSQQLAQAGASGGAAAAGAPGTTPVADTGASAAAGGAGSGPYAAEINAAAAKYHLDPAILRALIRQESNFDPNAHSSAGAEGLTQLMPGTAAALGVTNPLDPAQSIDGGAHYLSEQLSTFGGDVRKGLAAYNAGPGAVQQYGGVPPYAETQNYVQQIMSYANQYRSQAAASPTPASLLSGPTSLAQVAA